MASNRKLSFDVERRKICFSFAHSVSISELFDESNVVSVSLDKSCEDCLVENRLIRFDGCLSLFEFFLSLEKEFRLLPMLFDLVEKVLRLKSFDSISKRQRVDRAQLNENRGAESTGIFVEQREESREVGSRVSIKNVEFRREFVEEKVFFFGRVSKVRIDRQKPTEKQRRFVRRQRTEKRQREICFAENSNDRRFARREMNQRTENFDEILSEKILVPGGIDDQLETTKSDDQQTDSERLERKINKFVFSLSARRTFSLRTRISWRPEDKSSFRRSRSEIDVRFDSKRFRS